MSKITKLSLERLVQEMHILVEQEQKGCVGGANSAYFQFGNSFKDARLEDFASFQNPLSTQIRETERPYASTMLFEAEDSQSQHDIFAMVFIEKRNTTKGAFSGFIPSDDNEFGSGGIEVGCIGSGGVEVDFIGSGGIGSESPRSKKRIDTHPYKGVHIDKSVTQNSNLSNQMAELFESSEFRGILAPFIRGEQHVTFKVGYTGGATMLTTLQDNGNIVITLNQNHVGQKGFIASSSTTDNGGYKHSGVDSVFAVGLAHEAIHAKHFHIREEAIRYSGGDLSRAAEFVRSRYSSELANVMFVNNGGIWEQNPNYQEDEHHYFAKYNQEVLNKVLSQYRQ